MAKSRRRVPAGAAPRPWPGWLGLVAVAVLALGLRLAHLAELRDTPLVAVLIGDGQQYDAWASRIAGGQWLGTEIFYQAPLYPYVLAIVYSIAGHSPMAVRLLQAIGGTAACVLLAIAGRRFVGDRAGLAAGLLLAVYPPAIFFDGLIQKSSLDLFLVTLLLALLGQLLHRPRPGWLLGAGAVLGLFALNRENARVLYPVILGWFALGFRTVPVRTRVSWAAVFTLAAAVVVVPVGLRNAYVGGEFLISTSQLGPNLYIGNHAGARGSYEPLVPGRGSVVYEREDATRLAETASGRRLSPSEVSDYWVGRTIADVRRAPGTWLVLLGRKLLLTFNTRELVDTESLEAYAEFSRVLAALSWLGFGVVFPLAVFGAWHLRDRWPRLALLYASLGGLAGSVVIFYVVARYRFPLVPFTLLLAGAGAVALPRFARTARWWVGVSLAGVAAIVCYAPIAPAGDDTFINIGAELVRTGRPADALPLLEKAAAASPDYAPAQFDLGVALARAGDSARALERFAAAVRLRPDHAESRSAYALALQESGDATRALEQFHEAARLGPTDPKAQFNLANALVQAGKARDAEAYYEAALRLRPDYPEAHTNLGLTLRSIGDSAAALPHLEAAARLQPDSPGIQFSLAELLTDLARVPEALGHYEHAAQLSPGSLEFQYTLAQAYARASRWPDALAALQSSLSLARSSGQADKVREIEAAIDATRARLKR
jgi:tetratricopeptide (TPR) repeat protein